MPEFRLIDRDSGRETDVEALDADGAITELGRRFGEELTLIGDGETRLVLVKLDGAQARASSLADRGQFVYRAGD
jgi:hypothetical protein